MDEVAVLVLNGSFEPLHFTNARRAITLLLSGKAETVEPSPRVIRSPSHSFPLPSVIRLAIYIRKPFVERVAFNKKNILRRDHYACQYCGRRGDRLTVDHVVPRSLGGQTSWTNVVAACLRCNLRKGNRSPEEAGLALRRAPTPPEFLFSIHFLRHPHGPSFLDAWRKYLTSVPTVLPTGT
jgi:5-methylcytosine-specific restriction endonuclease McrA